MLKAVMECSVQDATLCKERGAGINIMILNNDYNNR